MNVEQTIRALEKIEDKTAHILLVVRESRGPLNSIGFETYKGIGDEDDQPGGYVNLILKSWH